MSCANTFYIPYSSRVKCVSFLAVFLFSQQIRAQDDPRYYRYQYHKYHWKAYHSSKFNIYFPADAADSLYRFIVKETPAEIERIKKATIKDVPKNLNIVIYPSVNQLYETNIGGYEPTQFTLPTFVYKGTRIVLAYNGSFADLKKQLSESLARALWESQLREGGEEDKGKNNKKSSKAKPSAKGNDIPFWFKEGAIRYFACGWTIDAEDKLRNSFEENNFTSWQQVLGYEPRLGGHAFCYFLAQNYYPTAVAQTVFQLKKKKSLQRAIRLIAKQNLDSLYFQCFDYYSKRFANKSVVTRHPKPTISIAHRKGIIQNVAINATGDLIAYISLNNGKRIVYLYNVKNKITKKITTYKLPPWIDDHSPDQYPLVAWDKTNQLYVAKPRKGKIDIRRYTPDGAMQESTVLYGVDGITSLQPLSANEFLLSAYRKGQSDIVSYTDSKEKYTPFTDDEYDDREPLFTGNKGELVFVSDRPKEYPERRTYLIGVGYKKDTLWQGIYTIQGKELKPIVVDSTHYIKWGKPVLLSKGELLVTTTKYGTEQYAVLTYPNGSTILLNEYHPTQYIAESDKIASYKTDEDSISITEQSLKEWLKDNQASPSDTTSPWLTDYKKILAKQAKEDSLLKHGKDTTHYILDDVFAPKGDKKKTKNKKIATKTAKESLNAEVRPYILQLHSAYFTAQVNNDYFINRYQPYLNYQGQFQSPEISGMTKGGFTDLLENHHFSIAYALPAATEGSTFFVRYENTEKKLDWGLSYFRKVETLKPDPKRNWVDENGNKYPDDAKDKIHYYEFFIKDPLSYYSVLGASTAVRQDKTVFLATDKYTLNFPPLLSAWSITSFSYNLNKLKPTLPYLYKGLKVNTSLDLFKGFDRQYPFLFGSAVNVQYHLPIYKYITLVTQLHTGYSGGDQKVLYNLGGVDNNVTPRVDTSVHFSQSAPYAFQTLITPFRGRYQNSLYGNEYFMSNADLYFPIFQTLIPLQTPLPFINNIQLGMLSDIASARETWNDPNPNNSKWLWSYGLSARSVLAGYPLRLEVAWPGTFRKQPVWYLSLNLQ